MSCRHYRDVAGDLIFGNQSEAEARHIYRLMNIGSKAIAMRMERARFVVAGCAAVFGWCVAIEYAPAQPLIPLAPPQPPIFNPSTPNTIPQTGEVPVSPNVPSAFPGAGAPGHSSSCSVFHRGPCFPQYLPPIGQDLRLTIVSTDANDPASKPDADASDHNDKARDEKPLDSIRAMYAE